jgi:hypothetical protein
MIQIQYSFIVALQIIRIPCIILSIIDDVLISLILSVTGHTILVLKLFGAGILICNFLESL